MVKFLKERSKLNTNRFHEFGKNFVKELKQQFDT